MRGTPAYLFGGSMITKDYYTTLVRQKKWEVFDKYFEGRPEYNASKLCSLSINPDDWVQFSINNFHNAQIKHECPKEYYSPGTNMLAEVSNQLGRDAGNSTDINFGVFGDTNEQLIELLGDDNINTLGVSKENLLVRLVVKLPGHGMAWHEDSADSYFNVKFKGISVDRTKLVRLWFPVADWQNGHVIQIGNSVLHHWAAGDVYQIPFGIGHASHNFGYHINYTVALTGLRIR